MVALADFTFRLYVAGGSSNSRKAIANLSALCLAHLPGRHTIYIVDVLEEPDRALCDSVFLVPSLLILAPLPVRRIVGTLSDAGAVLESLGLTPQPSGATA